MSTRPRGKRRQLEDRSDYEQLKAAAKNIPITDFPCPQFCCNGKLEKDGESGYICNVCKARVQDITEWKKQIYLGGAPARFDELMREFEKH